MALRFGKKTKESCGAGLLCPATTTNLYFNQAD